MVSAIIDCHSQLPTGWSIDFGGESWRLAAQALRHAILPKTSILQQYAEIKNDYDVWGIPELLVTDRGSGILNQHLRDTVPMLHMDVQPCPPRMPRMKGRIERWFQTADKQLLRGLSGCTFSNPILRGDYKAGECAVLTLSEVRFLFAYWIMEIYSREFHSRIRDIPIERWKQSAEQFLPVLPNQPSDLDPMIGYVQESHLSHAGIRFKYLDYGGGCLRLTELLRRSGKRSVLVKYRVDSQDLGHIWVFDPSEREFFEVFCNDYEYASGLTLALHMMIIQHARQRGLNEVRVRELAKMRDRLRSWVEDLMDQRDGHGRRRAARLLGSEGGRPVRQLASEAQSEANRGFADQWMGTHMSTPPGFGGAAKHAVASDVPVRGGDPYVPSVGGNIGDNASKQPSQPPSPSAPKGDVTAESHSPPAAGPIDAIDDILRGWEAWPSDGSEKGFRKP